MPEHISEPIDQDTERLVVYQLDWLSQVEARHRAVQQTMRLIERLRGTSHGAGSELSPIERQDVLADLSDELSNLDMHLAGERQRSHDMREIVRRLQDELNDLRRIVERLHSGFGPGMLESGSERPH